MEVSAKIAATTHHVALSLLRVLAQDKGNIFISPFSISTAVSMACCGARTETFEEMRHVLGLGDLSAEDIAASFNVLLSSLEKKDSAGYTFEYANSTAMLKGFSIKDGFKKILEESFHAPLFLEDFVNENQLAVDHINEWVESKTNGMVKDLVKRLDTNTAMVLLSAVYFKGTWQHQFEKKSTKLQKFFNGGDKKRAKDVEMMHLQEEFGFVQKETYKALQLPYQGKDIVMLVLLPNSHQGLQKLEQQLKQTFVEDLRKEMFMVKVNVSLPKFRFECASDLKKAFIKLGMRRVFAPDASDLSGIADCEPLFVDQILHKAVIDVNEEGSEAAAATAVVINYRCLVEEEEFTADHPFLFTIYNLKTKVNLFIGRIVEL